MHDERSTTKKARRFENEASFTFCQFVQGVCPFSYSNSRLFTVNSIRSPSRGKSGRVLTWAAIGPTIRTARALELLSAPRELAEQVCPTFRVLQQRFHALLAEPWQQLCQWPLAFAGRRQAMAGYVYYLLQSLPG